MSDKGFSLIELLLASLIMVITLLGLLGIFCSCLQLTEVARDLSVGISHGRCVMEEMRLLNLPSTIIVIDWTTWAQAEPPGGGGCNTLENESIKVTCKDVIAQPLEVLVTVNWTEKGRARSVQLATLLEER